MRNTIGYVTLILLALSAPAMAQLDGQSFSPGDNQIGGPLPTQPFQLQQYSGYGQIAPSPAQTIDPAVLPRLRYDPEKGLFTEATPEFFNQLQTLPEYDQRIILQGIGSIAPDAPTTMPSTDTKWLATELTPSENIELNDLIARRANLSPEEELTLQQLLEKSTPVPWTPYPAAPIPFPPRPKSTPLIVVGSSKICPDGRQLPAICSFTSSLPVCQCGED